MNLQEKILFYEIKAHSIESKEIQTKTEVGRTRFNSNFFSTLIVSLIAYTPVGTMILCIKLHITEGY